MKKLALAALAILLSLGVAHAANSNFAQPLHKSATSLAGKPNALDNTLGHICAAVWLPSAPKPGIQKTGAQCFVRGWAAAGSPCTCEGHEGHVIVAGGSADGKSR